VTATKARRLTGICRYATDRPAYAHLHAHCDGPWRRTYRPGGPAIVEGHCDCPCHGGAPPREIVRPLR
jgi:hypothetical protein